MNRVVTAMCASTARARSALLTADQFSASNRRHARGRPKLTDVAEGRLHLAEK
jgi:hypothetical protein